ncbi:MAG: TonB family protein [Terriglobia bacterium]
MPSVTEYSIARFGSQRVLLLVRDRRLRSHLQREFELAGCEVVAQAELLPRKHLQQSSFDVIVVEAALCSGGSGPEALGALREGLPAAQKVLLIGPAEGALADEARRLGFTVLARPTRDDAYPDFVRQALGRSARDSAAVPVEMDFDFLFRPGATPARHPAAAAPVEAVPVSRRLDFLLQQPEGTRGRRARSGLTALAVHALVLGLALLVPFVYPETLRLRDMASTLVVAPPPPPPPPPPAQAAARPRRVRPKLKSLARTLMAPAVIPKQVAEVVDAPDMEIEDGLDTLGVPGGVPGGQPGGVLGSLLASALPPPVELPAPALQKPLRVGGQVREPRIVRHVNPVYPPIARTARIEGQVRIDATIDTNGRIVEMRVLHGHPLLAKAAVEAVRQWVYEPTYLNNRPMPVLIVITVTFRLS